MFSLKPLIAVVLLSAVPAWSHTDNTPITATFTSNVKGVQHSQPTASITIRLSRVSNAPRLELPVTWNFGDNTFKNATAFATFPSGAQSTTVSATLVKIGSGGPVSLTCKLPGGETASSGVLFQIPKPIRK